MGRVSVAEGDKPVPWWVTKPDWSELWDENRAVGQVLPSVDNTEKLWCGNVWGDNQHQPEQRLFECKQEAADWVLEEYCRRKQKKM